jgi:uncharacterized protein (DUF1697 family)
MRFVVLLRGVNVGRANRVPMAALRTMHEWDAIVAGNPLADAAVDASRLLVAVAPHESVLEALAPAGKLVTKGEGWHLGHDAAYLH